MRRSKWSMVIFALAALAILVAVTSCAPTIYFVDRQTLMESEAAADWPEFEASAESRLLHKGPSTLAPQKESMKGKKFNRLLNGDLMESGTK
ncbi:MAG: hypothetical protein HQK50_03315 [Oligoflexia bacterium]|nr:hypothetical protein [Oligoflexia bacterium]MBF0364572.1 hypothetical protein [Oligoflexia bacterium]